MGRLKSLTQRTSKLPSRLAPAPAAGSWRAGKSSASRGYGYRWQQERASYLQLHPFCVMCLDELGVPRGLPAAEVVLACAAIGAAAPRASVVDHIVAHQGDPGLFWDRRNWQPLCASHHSADKQRAEAAGRQRFPWS